MTRILHFGNSRADGNRIEQELRRRGFAHSVYFVQSETAYHTALLKNSFDVILSDYTLPQYDGDKAFGLARELCPQTPFILVTGDLADEDAYEKLSAGITDYVLINNLSRLVPAIERARKEFDDRQARLRSETHYRSLFELSPDAIAVNHRGKLILVNSSCVKLLGARSANDIIGKPVLDFIHPDYHQMVRARIASLAAGAASTPIVRQKFIRLDGEIIDVEVTAAPFDYDGEMAIQVVVRDCTERVRAEEAINKSERRFHAMFSQSPIGIGVCNEEGQWIEFNDAGLKMFGLRHFDDIKSISLFDNPQITAEHREKLFRGEVVQLESAYDFDSVRENNFFPTSRTGVAHFHGVFAPLVEAEGGKPSGYLVQLQEITERKKADESLRQSEQRLGQIINLVPHFIFAKDIDGRFILVNKAVASVYGTTVKDLIGKTDADFARSEDEVRHFREDDQAVINSGNPKFIPEERITDATGRVRVLSTIKIPFTTSESTVPAILGVSVDITEQKKAEEALRELNAELEQRVSQRTAEITSMNKELESFSYAVSHDLRAPLRAISAFSQVLVEDASDKLGAEDIRHLHQIRDSAIHLGKLVQEILNFSRLSREELKKTNVDMKRLTEEVLAAQSAADGARKVRVTVDDLPSVHADRILVRQVIENLISNAVKFTSVSPAPAIEVGGYRKPNEVIYFVQDNGAGFDMEYYDKLFGFFQRLHSAEEFEGTGVGLAFCQRIIQRHGGRIWAEGEVGKGATFYFSLPVETEKNDE